MIKFNMTPAQQAADDARAAAYQEAAEAATRQTARNMTDDEYKAARAALTRPQRRAAPAAGKHVSEMTPSETVRELRRLGVNRRSVFDQHMENLK